MIGAVFQSHGPMRVPQLGRQHRDFGGNTAFL